MIRFNTIALIGACVLIHGCVLMDRSVWDEHANDSLNRIITFGYHPCQDAGPDACRNKENAEFKAWVTESAKKPLTIKSVADFLTSENFLCFQDSFSETSHLKCLFIHREYWPGLVSGTRPGPYRLWKFEAQQDEGKKLSVSTKIEYLGAAFKK